MISASIEMSIVCPKCENPIIINGPTNFGHCNACQNDTSISADFWKGTFEYILKSLIELDEGEEQTSRSFDYYDEKLTYVKLKPKCSECQTLLNLTTVDPNKESTITCTKCKNKTQITPTPAWLQYVIPVVEYFVNAQVLTKEKLLEPALKEGVAITCPRCGASLITDGKERIIKCDYCQLHVYLPDALWLRLHPVFIKSEWFIVYNEEKAKEIVFDEEEYDEEEEEEEEEEEYKAVIVQKKKKRFFFF